MVQSKAKTVEQYLEELPPERVTVLATVRKVILDHLPEGYEEKMMFGMIGYGIPLERYPNTYNGQPLTLASLASQKNFLTLYLMCVYGDPDLRKWFEQEWKKTGKKLNMGKSCIHFKKIEDLPLELIGETIARVSVDEYIRIYEKARQTNSQKKTQTSRRRKTSGDRLRA